MKNDDVQTPFGATILMKTVIFSKCQGGYQLIVVIWSGPFGRAPVVVLVIFKVARRSRFPFLGGTILDPQDPLWG